MHEKLHVAVVGAGRMGFDHIQRLHHRIGNADVSAVIDVDADRAKAAVQDIEGAMAFTEAATAFDSVEVNAVVVATPGFLHEDFLLDALKRDLPVLCEKPLTQDVSSSWNVVQAEAALGHRRIQVGFMRRFDAEYRELRDIIKGGDLGRLLMLHCSHRNPNVPEGYADGDIITEAAVHEFDIIRFLTGSEIQEVSVRMGRPSEFGGSGLHDPQQVLIQTRNGELADVEVFMNAQFGYQVATEAVFEKGTVSIGGHAGVITHVNGQWGGKLTAGFEQRFGAAYDLELQEWADAAREGRAGGASAWDGYAAAACCEAGLQAQQTGNPVQVALKPQPALYQY